jgi:biopolymer transport protein ExbD
MRHRRKHRHAKSVHTELEIMPMLNVFIAIIPLLLLSAAFVPVTVIKTTLPADGAVVPVSDAPLDLAIAIRPDAYVVQVNGSESNTIARSGADANQQLTAALQQIATAHPGHREVRIDSRADTRYEEIIQVMDAARAAGLPEAALAAGGGTP